MANDKYVFWNAINDAINHAINHAINNAVNHAINQINSHAINQANSHAIIHVIIYSSTLFIILRTNKTILTVQRLMVHSLIKYYLIYHCPSAIPKLIFRFRLIFSLPMIQLAYSAQ